MAAGVAIGVLAVRKVTAAKSALGPAGLNRAVGQASDSVTGFAEALRSGMREREADLRAALGVDQPDAAALTTADAPAHR
jgi:hypothetical protein